MTIADSSSQGSSMTCMGRGREQGVKAGRPQIVRLDEQLLRWQPGLKPEACHWLVWMSCTRNMQDAHDLVFADLDPMELGSST